MRSVKLFSSVPAFVRLRSLTLPRMHATLNTSICPSHVIPSQALFSTTPRYNLRCQIICSLHGRSNYHDYRSDPNKAKERKKTKSIEADQKILKRIEDKVRGGYLDTEITAARKEKRPYNIDKSRLSEEEKHMLRLLSKAIPMVADFEPLQIIHEDEWFLVVNKPSFIKMHPSHRFQGGSLLNRAIGHLGYTPHVLHRLDMVSSSEIWLYYSPSTDIFRL